MAHYYSKVQYAISNKQVLRCLSFVTYKTFISQAPAYYTPLSDLEVLHYDKWSLFLLLNIQVSKASINY